MYCLEIQKTNNDDLLSENASQQLLKTIASKIAMTLILE